MHEIPTPKTYGDYTAARNMRTMAVMSKQDRITGRQVLQENLNMKMLTDAGYVHDPITDVLERKR